MEMKLHLTVWIALFSSEISVFFMQPLCLFLPIGLYWCNSSGLPEIFSPSSLAKSCLLGLFTREQRYYNLQIFACYYLQIITLWVPVFHKCFVSFWAPYCLMCLLCIYRSPLSVKNKLTVYTFSSKFYDLDFCNMMDPQYLLGILMCTLTTLSQFRNALHFPFCPVCVAAISQKRETS